MPDRDGRVDVLCKISARDNIVLQVMWRHIQYDVWLDRIGDDAYSGVYEIRKRGLMIRGKAACKLSTTQEGIGCEGTFNEDCRDYVFTSKLNEIRAEDCRFSE